MTLYKLMNSDRTTRNGQRWNLGVRVEKAACDNPQLCSSDVLHAYKNVNLAYLLAPIHNISTDVLAECEGDIAVADWDKVGCFSLTPTKWLDAPAWVGSDNEHFVHIAFAVLCAESVVSIYNAKHPDDDRPQKAIDAVKAYLNNPTEDAYACVARAAYAADAAARATADAAEAVYFAALAARAAARAADAAEAVYFAACAADAAEAVYFAACAARATRATRAAARAADAVYFAACAAGAMNIDFCDLADKAVGMIMQGAGHE